MILEANKNDVILSGVQKEVKFKILANSHSFKLLSDTMYSNKVKAIIRELSCNAVDSHTAANTLNKPFAIHLPNSLEPWFSIRDYGTGLSMEDMDVIYTTQFYSTKNTSNSYTGCFGIGKLAPMSYADSFTTISYFNGVRSIYNVFIDEDDCPSCVALNSEKTTEPNGLEIHLPVKSQDFNRFKLESQQVLRDFETGSYEVVGAEFEPIVSDYAETRGNGWKKVKNASGSCAIMGRVRYPIPTHSNDFTNSENIILSLGLELFFELGELEFTPSRETLSMKKRTIDAIKNKLADVMSLYKKIIMEDIVKADSLIKASMAFSDYCQNNGFRYHNLFKATDFTWKGKALLDNTINFNKVIPPKDSWGSVYFPRFDHNGMRLRRQREDRFYIGGKSAMMIDDGVSYSQIRIKNFLIENKGKIGNAIVIPSAESAFIREFCKIADCKEDFFIKLSSLPKPVIARTKNTSGSVSVASTIYKWNGVSYNGMRSWEKLELKDAPAGDKFYVEMSNYNVDCRALADRKAIVNELGGVVTGIYGVKASLIAGLDKTWKSFDEYGKEVKEKFIKSNKSLMREVKNSNALSLLSQTLLAGCMNEGDYTSPLLKKLAISRKRIHSASQIKGWKYIKSITHDCDGGAADLIEEIKAHLGNKWLIVTGLRQDYQTEHKEMCGILDAIFA